MGNPAPPLERKDALFLDFDGSLVEIAHSPGAVVVDAELPKLLQSVKAGLKGAVAVISGRRLDDLLALLRPFEGAAAGNHGLERLTAYGDVIGPPRLDIIDEIQPMLREFAAQAPGVSVEDKGLGVAIHYRASPRQAKACQEIARNIERLSNYQLVASQGKMVVEIRPLRSNKGSAILDFLGEAPFTGRRPVFVGDDATDEDGFAIVNRLGGVSILVGAPEDTSARYELADVAAAKAWLSEFVARSPFNGGGAQVLV